MSEDKDREVWEALHEFARGDFGPAGKRQPLTLHRRMRNEVILTKALQALSSCAPANPDIDGSKYTCIRNTALEDAAREMVRLYGKGCAAQDYIRALKGAPVPESEATVAFHKLLQDEGEEYEGPDSTPQPEAPTPRTAEAIAKFQRRTYTGACVCVDAEDMAKLERELAEAETERDAAQAEAHNCHKLIASRSASAEHDPWKEAVIDGLIVAHIYSKADEEDPRKALNKLLAWEQSVALDPKVSSDAEALVERGRQSALSSSAAITREKLESLPHAAYGSLNGWTAHYVPVESVLSALSSTAPSVPASTTGETK